MKQQPTFRRSLIKRTVVYTLMTVSVVLFSTALLFILLGYRFNKDQGTFEQGGLVQFVSRPTGAEITIGNAKLRNHTNSKITVNPGSYEVTMKLAGYRTWSKNVSVEAGKVLWLNSVHFVPESPVTEPLVSLPKTLGSTAARASGDYYVYVTNPNLPEISTIRVNDSNPSPQVVTIAANIYHAAKKHSFKVESISKDNHHILVKHSYDKQTEWIMINRNDQSRTRVLGGGDAAAVVQVYDNPRDENTVFLRYKDGSVRTENLDSGTRSGVLVKSVASISITDQGTILYALAPQKGMTTLGYLSYQVAKPRTIATIKTSEPVHMSSGVYYGTFYVSTAYGDTLTVDKYDLFPRSDDDAPLRKTTIKTITSSDTIVDLATYTDGRFVVARQASQQIVYDLELAQQSVTPLYKVTKASMHAPWIDDYHYFTDASGRFRQYEFDGTNQTDITSVAPGYSAMYSANLKYLYTIATTPDGYQLQRTNMIVD